jgi:uncharacterized protein
MPNPAAPISTEVFVIPYETAYLVYAPLRRLAFVANAPTVNLIAQLREKPLENPTEEQAALLDFLDGIRLTGADGDVLISGLDQPDFKPTEVTLFLTSECNLRCVYCYARAGDLAVERMSMETAQRGIDYVVANALELNTGWFGLYFHGGGEPTINHEVLVGSHEYAKMLAEQYGLELTTSIATNGVLSPKSRRWIIENLQGASVSLDGSPEVNDRNRPNIAGGGSGSRVLETLHEFDAANFPYGVRVTVSAQTVHEIANTVRYIVENTHPARIQVEPVYDIGRGENASLHVEIDAFINGYRESWQLAHEHGIELEFSSARLDEVTSRFCRAYGEGFQLTPQGNVTGCYEVYSETADFAEDIIFGQYDAQRRKYILDQNKLQKMRDHNVENQPWCNGCFAKWHCSGDCPNKVLHASINGEFRGMPSCEITRAIVLDQIVRKISDSGGVVWVEDIE